MEQHLQDVPPKVMHNKNLESFAAHFAKHFTQKPIPQKWCEIMSFGIISAVNYICSMKTWGESSCKMCIKEII